MKKIALIFLLFFCACQNEKKNSKAISIFLESSASRNNKSRHIQIFLNGKMLADRRISANYPTDIGNMITCFTVNSQQKNILLLKINMQATNIDLDKYSTDCLSIHAVYDEITIVSKKIREADSIAISYKRKLNPNFSDSVIAHTPEDRLDTLTFQVDKKLCPCKVMK